MAQAERQPPRAGKAAVPAADSEPGRTAALGTFVGVFRPTLLTIIGVLLYVRTGWLVGHGGLIGALMVLGLTFAITGATALSFSAIATNTRIGAGGAFALVSQSLGLEAGGAIGLPLYAAQGLSVAFYAFGFAEGWRWFFPGHPGWMVVVAVMTLVFGLSAVSERLTLNLQVVVLAIVVLALACLWGGLLTVNTYQRPALWGDTSLSGLWPLFAVYFPAGSGIMVGASLSGKLADPRRSIPRGSLGAWGVALMVYLVTLVALAYLAPMDELRADYMVAAEYALWGPGVMIGLMASCLSAAMGSVVAAPNVLHALARHRIVPYSELLSRETEGGTPRNAVLVTAGLVAMSLSLGDLNRVAQLITMCFLITYATINIVVLVEQTLGLISFRPSLKVPIVVPVFGAFSSVFTAVIINPAFGMIALGVVVVIYVVLVQRHLETPWETVRSGLVVALADRVAKRTQHISGPQYRAWKPDLLVPIARPSQLVGEHQLLRALVRPRGSVQVLTVAPEPLTVGVLADLDEEIGALRREDILATHAEIEVDRVVEGARIGLSVLGGSLFPPNVLFVHAHGQSEVELQELFDLARARDVGFCLMFPHPDAGLGREREINVWLPRGADAWRLGLSLPNLDLALLFGHQISRNWGGGKLRLCLGVEDESRVETGRAFLAQLADVARLAHDTELWVAPADHDGWPTQTPHADVNLLPVESVRLEDIESLAHRLRSTCLFLHDSSQESALA